MKIKYYAVRKGKKTGIFNNWKECEENIKNFSGAEYKSFNNKNDAEKYINVDSELNLKQKENKLIELYDYLRKQRHTTVHLNSILESSRIIETMDEAKQIVNDIINNINDFYC